MGGSSLGNDIIILLPLGRVKSSFPQEAYWAVATRLLGCCTRLSPHRGLLCQSNQYAPKHATSQYWITLTGEWRVLITPENDVVLLNLRVKWYVFLRRGMGWFLAHPTAPREGSRVWEMKVRACLEPRFLEPTRRQKDERNTGASRRHGLRTGGGGSSASLPCRMDFLWCFCDNIWRWERKEPGGSVRPVSPMRATRWCVFVCSAGKNRTDE